MGTLSVVVSAGRRRPAVTVRRLLAASLVLSIGFLGDAIAPTGAVEGPTSLTGDATQSSGVVASAVTIAYALAGTGATFSVGGQDVVVDGTALHGISIATTTAGGTVTVSFTQPVSEASLRISGLAGDGNPFRTATFSLGAVDGGSTTGTTLTATDTTGSFTVSGTTMTAAAGAFGTYQTSSGTVRFSKATGFSTLRLDVDQSGFLASTDTVVLGASLHEDLGDAPASYDVGTGGAARHTLGTVRLGAAVTRDAETTVNPTTSPNAGAAATGDADDGVVTQPILRTDTTSYPVVVSTSGSPSTQSVAVAGWLDTDLDGAFEPAERGTASGTVATNLTVPIPVSPTALVPGSVVYQRLRLLRGTVAPALPIGALHDGEVEDTRLVVEPRAPTITTPVTSATTGPTPTVTGTGEPGSAITVREATTTRCTATVAANGTWTCTSSALTTGSHTFVATQVVTATGITLGTQTATVTFTVAALTLQNDALTVAQGATGSIDVLANDTVPAGGTFGRTVGTRYGSVTCTTAGVCSYRSLDAYVGTDTFTYQVTSGATTATATVTFTVTKVNTAPIVRDDRAVTSTGSAVSIDVLADDEDPDGASSSFEPSGPNRPGDSLTITTTGARTVTPSSLGTASCTATACTFTPASGTTGTGTFTYTAADTSGSAGSATVTVRVDPAALTTNGFAGDERAAPSLSSGSFTATGATPTATASCVSAVPTMTVSWAATTNATSYRLERRVTGDTTFVVVARGLTTTSFTDTRLGEATAFEYRVRPELQRWVGTAGAASTAATVAKPSANPVGCAA